MLVSLVSNQTLDRSSGLTSSTTEEILQCHIARQFRILPTLGIYVHSAAGRAVGDSRSAGGDGDLVSGVDGGLLSGEDRGGKAKSSGDNGETHLECRLVFRGGEKGLGVLKVVLKSCDRERVLLKNGRPKSKFIKGLIELKRAVGLEKEEEKLGVGSRAI